METTIIEAKRDGEAIVVLRTTLSDGSHAWAVRTKDRDERMVTFACVDQQSAYALTRALRAHVV